MEANKQMYVKQIAFIWWALHFAVCWKDINPEHSGAIN